MCQGRLVDLDCPTHRMRWLSIKTPARHVKDESVFGGVEVGLKEGHPWVPLSDRSRHLLA